MEKVVILAAGRGNRMRRSLGTAKLSREQAEIARDGLKVMMPVGRPLIDYILSGLIQAGYDCVCLVLGPDHQTIRNHCLALPSDALDIHFGVQPEPLGTADAVLAAANFVADDNFTLINSDNYYPVGALAKLRTCPGAAVAGFLPDGLCTGNISSERLRSFSVLMPGERGTLAQVVEKPREDSLFSSRADLLIGMNCWRFTPRIFEACRSILPSVRNELELTDAVNFSIARMKTKYEIIPVNEPVLDLSTQADVPEVASRLSSLRVEL